MILNGMVNRVRLPTRSLLMGSLPEKATIRKFRIVQKEGLKSFIYSNLRHSVSQIAIDKTEILAQNLSESSSQGTLRRS